MTTHGNFGFTVPRGLEALADADTIIVPGYVPAGRPLPRLDQQLTVAELAAHAQLSPRTFLRRFAEETGSTPMQWILRARVDTARELLESTRLSIDRVAEEVGLGTGSNLRLHFRRLLDVSPTEYRATFAGRG